MNKIKEKMLKNGITDSANCNKVPSSRAFMLPPLLKLWWSKKLTLTKKLRKREK